MYSLRSNDEFRLTTSVPVPTHYLSVSSTGSGHVDAEDTGSIEEGREISLETEANSGYVFDHWSGDFPDGHRTDSAITVTMDSDKDLMAHFEAA